MPFISEEIWQTLPGTKTTPSIMQAAYPSALAERSFPREAAAMERVMEVISAIRNIRGEMEVPPSKQIAVILSCASPESLALMQESEGPIINMARISELTIGMELEKPGDASIQVAGDVQIFVPLRGLVNVDEEERRLVKEIGKIEKEIEMFSKKLENPSFVDRAPADVVAKEREKLAEVTGKKRVLEESLEKIRSLK